MDYIRDLELQMASLQRKIRLLQDLRFFFDSSSPEELALFGEELSSVATASGESLASAITTLIAPGTPRPQEPMAAAAPPPPVQEPPTPPRRAPERRSAAAPAPAEGRGGEVSQEEAAPTPRGAEASSQGGGGELDQAMAAIERAMVAIPATSFVMGSETVDAEKPPHKVSLSGYRICDHLVTNREYALFVAANPQWAKDRADPELRDEGYLEDWSGGSYPEGKEDHPVAFVSHHAASAFAGWLGKRLPTEAEWECAARGGLVGKKYPNGDLMNDKLANLAKQYRGTTPVKKFEANGYNLYDMAGNLFEWCADWYAPYSPGEAVDPKGPAEGEYKVARGGSWMSGAGALRVSARVDMEAAMCAQVGIRVVDGGSTA